MLKVAQKPDFIPLYVTQSNPNLKLSGALITYDFKERPFKSE